MATWTEALISPADVLVRVIWSEAPGLRWTTVLSAFTKSLQLVGEDLHLFGCREHRRDARTPAAPTGALVDSGFVRPKGVSSTFWSTYQYHWPSTSFLVLGIGTFSGVP